MLYIFGGFLMGFPLGFYCKENRIDPPIQVNGHAIRQLLKPLFGRADRD